MSRLSSPVREAIKDPSRTTSRHPAVPRWSLLGVLLAVSVLGGQSAAQTPMQVEWKGAKLSVDAKDAPLAQILAEVGKDTGVQMQNLTGLTDSVSAHFSGLTLGAGLQSLLSGVDYAVFGNLSSPQGLAAARVVILKNLESSEVTPPRPAVTAPPRRVIAVQAAKGGAVDANKLALERQVMGPDVALQARAFEQLMSQDPQAAAEALEQAVGNAQGPARLQALQLLDQDSQSDDQTVIGVMRQVLQDGDVSMRDYAVQAIARRGGPETMDLLTQAYSDPDAQVRMTVIQNAAQQKDGGLDLLRQATSDPDPSVASAASALVQALTASQEQQ